MSAGARFCCRPGTITPLRRILAAALIGLAGLLAVPSAQAAAKLSADDKADIKRIEAYLNALGTLKSHFLQVSSNGTQAEGDVYVNRPGRMRIQYDPPTPVEIVATGTFLVYHDKDLEQVTWLGMDATPAGILLDETVQLSGKVTVLGLEREATTLRVTMAKTDDPTAGTLTLVFADKPLSLKKWTVVDAQGLLTTVALINPAFGVPLAKELFSFTDPYANKPSIR